MPSPVLVLSESNMCEGCSYRLASRRLWLLISGQFRTFHYTQHDMVEMAHRSSAACYVAVAAMPPEICSPAAEAPHECRFRSGPIPLRWDAFAKSIDSVPDLLHTASRQAFGGRLAYVVVRRQRGSVIDSWLEGAWVLWRAVWELTKLVIEYHGLQARPESVVIRTRPDVHYTASFDLGPLSTFFLRGWRGRHLILSSVTWNSSANDLPATQGDIHLITSFGAYLADIGEAFSANGWRGLEPQLAEATWLGRVFLANSWSIGWSLLPAYHGFLMWSNAQRVHDNYIRGRRGADQLPPDAALASGGRLCACVPRRYEHSPWRESVFAVPGERPSGAWPTEVPTKVPTEGPIDSVAPAESPPGLSMGQSSGSSSGQVEGELGHVAHAHVHGQHVEPSACADGRLRSCLATIVESPWVVAIDGTAWETELRHNHDATRCRKQRRGAPGDISESAALSSSSAARPSSMPSSHRPPPLGFLRRYAAPHANGTVTCWSSGAHRADHIDLTRHVHFYCPSRPAAAAASGSAKAARTGPNQSDSAAVPLGAYMPIAMPWKDNRSVFWRARGATRLSVSPSATPDNWPDGC